MTRIELRIDELVLRGVPTEYAGDIAAQVEERLTRLAQEHDTPLADARSDDVRPVASRTPAEGAGGLAAEVARQVWAAAVQPAGGGR